MFKVQFTLLYLFVACKRIDNTLQTSPPPFSPLNSLAFFACSLRVSSPSWRAGFTVYGLWIHVIRAKNVVWPILKVSHALLSHIYFSPHLPVERPHTVKNAIKSLWISMEQQVQFSVNPCLNMFTSRQEQEGGTLVTSTTADLSRPHAFLFASSHQLKSEASSFGGLCDIRF